MQPQVAGAASRPPSGVRTAGQAALAARGDLHIFVNIEVLLRLTESPPSSASSGATSRFTFGHGETSTLRLNSMPCSVEVFPFARFLLHFCAACCTPTGRVCIFGTTATAVARLVLQAQGWSDQPYLHLGDRPPGGAHLDVLHQPQLLQRAGAGSGGSVAHQNSLVVDTDTDFWHPLVHGAVLTATTPHEPASAVRFRQSPLAAGPSHALGLLEVAQSVAAVHSAWNAVPTSSVVTAVAYCRGTLFAGCSFFVPRECPDAAYIEALAVTHGGRLVAAPELATHVIYAPAPAADGAAAATDVDVGLAAGDTGAAPVHPRCVVPPSVADRFLVLSEWVERCVDALVLYPTIFFVPSAAAGNLGGQPFSQPLIAAWRDGLPSIAASSAKLSGGGKKGAGQLPSPASTVASWLLARSLCRAASCQTWIPRAAIESVWVDQHVHPPGSSSAWVDDLSSAVFDLPQQQHQSAGKGGASSRGMMSPNASRTGFMLSPDGTAVAVASPGTAKPLTDVQLTARRARLSNRLYHADVAVQATLTSAGSAPASLSPDHGGGAVDCGVQTDAQDTPAAVTLPQAAVGSGGIVPPPPPPPPQNHTYAVSKKGSATSVAVKAEGTMMEMAEFKDFDHAVGDEHGTAGVAAAAASSRTMPYNRPHHHHRDQTEEAQDLGPLLAEPSPPPPPPPPPPPASQQQQQVIPSVVVGHRNAAVTPVSLPNAPLPPPHAVPPSRAPRQPAPAGPPVDPRIRGRDGRAAYGGQSTTPPPQSDLEAAILNGGVPAPLQSGASTSRPAFSQQDALAAAVPPPPRLRGPMSEAGRNGAAAATTSDGSEDRNGRRDDAVPPPLPIVTPRPAAAAATPTIPSRTLRPTPEASTEGPATAQAAGAVNTQQLVWLRRFKLGVEDVRQRSQKALTRLHMLRSSNLHADADQLEAIMDQFRNHQAYPPSSQQP